MVRGRGRGRGRGAPRARARKVRYPPPAAYTLPAHDRINGWRRLYGVVVSAEPDDTPAAATAAVFDASARPALAVVAVLEHGGAGLRAVRIHDHETQRDTGQMCVVLPRALLASYSPCVLQHIVVDADGIYAYTTAATVPARLTAVHASVLNDEVALPSLPRLSTNTPIADVDAMLLATHAIAPFQALYAPCVLWGTDDGARIGNDYLPRMLTLAGTFDRAALVTRLRRHSTTAARQQEIDALCATIGARSNAATPPVLPWVKALRAAAAASAAAAITGVGAGVTAADVFADAAVPVSVPEAQAPGASGDADAGAGAQLDAIAQGGAAGPATSALADSIASGLAARCAAPPYHLCTRPTDRQRNALQSGGLSHCLVDGSGGAPLFWSVERMQPAIREDAAAFYELLTAAGVAELLRVVQSHTLRRCDTPDAGPVLDALGWGGAPHSIGYAYLCHERAIFASRRDLVAQQQCALLRTATASAGTVIVTPAAEQITFAAGCILLRQARARGVRLLWILNDMLAGADAWVGGSAASLAAAVYGFACDSDLVPVVVPAPDSLLLTFADVARLVADKNVDEAEAPSVVAQLEAAGANVARATLAHVRRVITDGLAHAFVVFASAEAADMVLSSGQRTPAPGARVPAAGAGCVPVLSVTRSSKGVATRVTLRPFAQLCGAQIGQMPLAACCLSRHHAPPVTTWDGDVHLVGTRAAALPWRALLSCVSLVDASRLFVWFIGDEPLARA